MFMVTVENNGTKFWLRGTTWAFTADRGNKFETRELAMAAWQKAYKFAAPAIRKKVQIETV